MRRRLLFIALAGIAPLAVIAAFCFVVILHDQQRETERTSLDVARLSAAAIDVEMQQTLALLGLLAAAPELHRGDLGAYANDLRHVLPRLRGWLSIRLAALDGTVLIDAAAAPGQAPAPLLERESWQRVLITGVPQVGALLRNARGQWLFPISVPVFRNGRLEYVLSAQLSPAAILRVLQAQRLPETWTASILDAKGQRIARSKAHEQYLGKGATPSLSRLLAAGGREGIGTSTTMEGTPVYTAFVKLPEFGWTVAVGLPTAQVEAGALRAFLAYGSGILLSIALAVVAALMAARRINEPIRELLYAAQLIGSGAVPAPVKGDIREVREVGNALVASAQARRASEQERDGVLAELERARLDLTRRVADLQRLHDLSNELLRLPTLSEQLQATLKALCDFHGARHGMVALCEAGDERIELRAALGFSTGTEEVGAVLCAPEGPCAMAIREDRRLVLPDLTQGPHSTAMATLMQEEGIRGAQCAPLRGRHGGILGVIAVFLPAARAPSEREMHLTDLCAGLVVVFVERARAEAEAGESERRLRVALDSSPVPFNILAPMRDATGVIVDFSLDYLNRAAAAALQRPTEVLRNRPLGEALPEGWDDGELLRAYAAVVERGEVREFEFRPEGGARPWFRVVASPFQGRVAVWFEDVTERKQQEQLLRDADRRKDEFLATLAHELRNPLAPIRQAALLAGLPSATESQKRWSQEVIDRQVRHMALLLDDLLDVSRITRGKMQLRKSFTELRAVVEAALETARPAIDAKGHRLRIDLPAAPLHLHVDPLRFSQILANLLTNAAKYTPAGGQIRISARVSDGEVLVDVEDNGIGIVEQDLPLIFGMFAQVRRTQDHNVGGLGIGLALARGLAELHGGSLGVRSEGLGRGSCFSVRLPLDVVEPLPLPDKLPPPTRSLVRRRVLVADDNRDAAETLAQFLRLSGHEVALAYDGEEAVEQYDCWRPDVALIDIGMPKLNGHEVARTLRRPPRGTTITLIALTGWGQFKDQLQSINAGFDHHLTKPVEPDLLLTLIAERTGPGAPVDAVETPVAAASGASLRSAEPG